MHNPRQYVQNNLFEVPRLPVHVHICVCVCVLHCFDGYKAIMYKGSMDKDNWEGRGLKVGGNSG